MASKPTVEFYYDISCPFAYIASLRIEALAIRSDAILIWRPVLLGGIYRATAAPQGAAGSASDVLNPTRRNISTKAFRRTLQRFNISYNDPPRHPIKTTAPLRLLYFFDEKHRPQLTHGLFRAYWVEGKDVSTNAVLSEIVREILGPTAAKAVEHGVFEGKQERRMLEESTNIAVQRGSPGVPAFWIADERWVNGQGEEKQGRLRWGQDRLHFVERALIELEPSSRNLLSLMPRCSPPGTMISGNEEVKLQFWRVSQQLDYRDHGTGILINLGMMQFGLQLQIEMKPFLLGILFKEIGAPNTPGSAVSKQRQNYNGQDHAEWVQWWNAVNERGGHLDPTIDFHWATKFPIRTPTILRAILVEPKLIDALYRACWERDLDMSSDCVLQNVISEAGYDGTEIVSRANSAGCKSDLRARTKEAVDTGLCGVPSYRVFRRKKGEEESGWKLCSDIIWGQDELPVVEDIILGWKGKGVAEVRPTMNEISSSRL